LPNPWYQSNLEQFTSGVVEVGEDGSGRYGYLISNADKTARKGTVLQHVSPPEEWLGKRVRLTAKLKTKLEYGSAYMFMNIESSYDISQDHMEGRSISGENNWQTYSIVLDVPFEPTTSILFGVGMYGKGEIFFDDFKFEVVGQNVETTGRVDEKIKRRPPSNLDFEFSVTR
jgi:hypothetical protein